MRAGAIDGDVDGVVLAIIGSATGRVGDCVVTGSRFNGLDDRGTDVVGFVVGDAAGRFGNGFHGELSLAEIAYSGGINPVDRHLRVSEQLVGLAQGRFHI